jgi:hypothetical protein
MSVVRVGLFPFALALISSACELERGGDARDSGASCPPPCAMLDDGGLDAGLGDGQVQPEDGGGPSPLDAMVGLDGSDLGWDGVEAEPYLCGQPGLEAMGVLELGHADAIRALKRSGSRVLSQDGFQRWVLWDTERRAPVAQGLTRAADTPAGRVDMAAALVTIPVEQGIELRTAETGELRGLIATQAPYGLARDGSYVWSADEAALTVWSPVGVSLFSKPGAYAAAQVYAGPSELRVANGPLGAQLIERIARADGTSTSAPFVGTFLAWFDDGERFIARVEGAIVVYSRDGIEQRRFPMLSSNSVGGHGNHLWALRDDDGSLCSYAVDGPMSDLCVPVARGAQLEPLRGGVVVRGGERTAFSADGLDLTGPAPRPVRFALPSGFTQAATDEGGRWALGDDEGALAFGPALANGASFARLGCGRVLALAGSAGTLAAATADGIVRLFAIDGERLTLRRSIPIAATALSLSEDGALLALGKSTREVRYYQGDQSLRLLTLQEPAIRRYERHVYDSESGASFTFALAASGARLARLACAPIGTAGACRLEVGDTLAARGYLDTQFTPVLRTALPPIDATVFLSPSGRHAVVSYASAYPDRLNMKSYVYLDGQLLATIEGRAIGFAGEEQLVIIREREAPMMSATVLTDLSGQELATLAQFAWGQVAPIDAQHFYASSESVVYNVAERREVWTGPRQGERQRGAVLGPTRVAYTNEHRLVLYRWRDL